MKSERSYQGHPMFYEILNEMRDLHDRKNAQYASSKDPLGNFRRGSNISNKLINPKIKNKELAYLLVLMSKQIDGVMEMLGEGKDNTVEEIEDKLLDMATYSVIGIILRREENRL